MANPGTDYLALVEIRFTWNGQLVENRLHFRHATSPEPGFAELDALCNTVLARVVADWLPLMSTTVSLREVYAETYNGAGSLGFSLLGSGTGSASGNGMPGNASFCLSLRSGNVGRSRRGRMYTIGMVEAHQDSGVVTSTYRNAWLAALSALIAAALGDDWILCIASFISGGAPRASGFLTDVTTVIAIDDFVDSQRRRLQGRGS